MAGLFFQQYSKLSVPIPLVNLQLWLDGDNPLNTNSRWYDKSPNNYVISQSTAVNQPTLTANLKNGHAGYVFDGTNDYFDGGNILNLGTNSNTIYIVFNMKVSNGAILSKSLYGPANSRYSVWDQSNIAFLYYENKSRDTPVFGQLNVYKIIAIINNRSTNTNNLYTYGGTADNNTAPISGIYNMTSTFNFLIGAYNNSSGGIPPQPGHYLNGNINEIIFYNRLLTTAETTTVENYLRNKYAI